MRCSSSSDKLKDNLVSHFFNDQLEKKLPLGDLASYTVEKYEKDEDSRKTILINL